MTDIRRTVLWVVFTMSLVLLWDGWQKYNGHDSLFLRAAPHAETTAGTAPASSASGVPAATAGTAAVASAASPAASQAVAAESVVIHTDVMNVTLSTRGGSVTRVELLKYLSAPEPDVLDSLQEMVGLKKKPDVQKEPIVLLDAARSYEAQSGLLDSNGKATVPGHNTVMTLVPGDRTLKDGENQLVVKLESPEVGGVKLVKTFTFTRGEYVVGVKHEVVNVGAAPVTPQLYVQLVRDGELIKSGPKMAPSSFTGPAVYNEKAGFHTVKFEDLAKGKKADIDPTADNGWVAMIQHYFASAWLPAGNAQREFYVTPVPDSQSKQFQVGMLFTLPQLAPGATESQDDKLFIGPQEENKLAALTPGLQLVKDYGIFKVLSQPLFWLLDHLHQWIGNWGWAIIGLVVLLKMAFFWLNASAYRSMAKMKAVGPRIQALNERFKDKPQEKQQEMMRIYREEKINPIGSCLPIFLQMPFFMGLYWVLLSSVEMRGAPWLGWITDLSQRDPYFILPLILTASSLLQVALNPKSPDPVQAKMMWFMPLAFSVMFFVFPSGLVLYWLTNNILSIAQQWLINKKMGVQN
ncbi:MAG TPA: membrane protein insertase YidC [Burkholderiaceae bacterium]|jgi:YidC/Oxa1 family membrane protein insertase